MKKTRRVALPFDETIEVRSNLILTTRERGKLVARRKGHNIFLNLGREWLTQLIAYSSFSPLTTFTDDRIRYMGLGIGGNRQLAPSTANSAPLLTAYPGTNAQVDTDPTVTRLERPVRVSGGSTDFPAYLASDTWIGQVQAPSNFPSAREVTFARLFTQLEISYLPYLTVPLSEVMLFTNGAGPHVYNNTGVAYDVFDTLSKTDAFELEVAWTLQF
jgi:hypothetical protein